MSYVAVGQAVPSPSHLLGPAGQAGSVSGRGITPCPLQWTRHGWRATVTATSASFPNASWSRPAIVCEEPRGRGDISPEKPRGRREGFNKSSLPPGGVDVFWAWSLRGPAEGMGGAAPEKPLVPQAG